MLLEAAPPLDNGTFQCLVELGRYSEYRLTNTYFLEVDRSLPVPSVRLHAVCSHSLEIISNSNDLQFAESTSPVCFLSLLFSVPVSQQQIPFLGSQFISTITPRNRRIAAI